MKKLIAIAATALVGLVAFPESAEAGRSSVSYTYQSGRSSCGCPIYTKRYVRSYDCYRRPIYRYARVPVVHRCSSHSGRHHSSHSGYYHRSSHGRSHVTPHYRHSSRHPVRPTYNRGYSGRGYSSNRRCR